MVVFGATALVRSPKKIYILHVFKAHTVVVQ